MPDNYEQSVIDEREIPDVGVSKGKHLGAVVVLVAIVVGILFMMLKRDNNEVTAGNQNKPVEYGTGIIRDIIVPEDPTPKPTAAAKPRTVRAAPTPAPAQPQPRLDGISRAQYAELQRQLLEFQKQLEKVEAEKRAARRASPVMSFDESVAEAPAVAEAGAATTGGIAETSREEAPLQTDQGNVTSAPISIARRAPARETTIYQGKLITGVLETAIHSDLTGRVRAKVSRDIYSEDGSRVLIPRESRLVGQYESDLKTGQTRVFISWNRVIRPDGIDVTINSPGTDRLGRTGLTGTINRHWWQRFGSSLLLSVVGIGLGDLAGNDEDRGVIADDAQSPAEISLNDSIDIPPTILVPQGERINVFVAIDLDFKKVLGG